MYSNNEPQKIFLISFFTVLSITKYADLEKKKYVYWVCIMCNYWAKNCATLSICFRAFLSMCVCCVKIFSVGANEMNLFFLYS